MGDAQIILDRVVPIDGHPLEQGTIQVMVRSFACERERGGGA